MSTSEARSRARSGEDIDGANKKVRSMSGASGASGARSGSGARSLAGIGKTCAVSPEEVRGLTNITSEPGQSSMDLENISYDASNHTETTADTATPSGPADTYDDKAEKSTLLTIAFQILLFIICCFVLFLVTSPPCFKYGEPLDPGCQHPALPHGIIFSLVLVVVSGNIAGKTMQTFCKLPGLLGMLACGYCLRNFVPGAMDGIDAKNNSRLRTIALGMIMIRAGMGLNIAKLREQLGQMAALSTIPCLCEATTIAMVSQWTFPQMNFPWALMLGFVIADVSPAVTTPLLLHFQDQGMGTDKGIPSILLAGGSVNSVLAIVFYSIMWEFSWGDGIAGFAIVELIMVKLVVQIFAVGVLAGWLEGLVLAKVWSRLQSTTERFFLIVGMGMCNLFGFKLCGMGGGGTLATLTFGASVQYYISKNGYADTKSVQDIISAVWAKLGSVILFTLLGASIDQSKLDGILVGWAAVTITLGLGGRAIATFASCTCLRDWSCQERAFAVVSWCPKATVQAALASRALDHVNAQIAKGTDKFVNDKAYVDTMTERSHVILTAAVLSIIMTAPTFAVLMSIAGERWLTKSGGSSGEKDSA